MQLTNEQVQVGVAAGLALTDPDGDGVVPMKHASGAIILRQLCLAVAQGQVGFAPLVQQEPPDGAPTPNPTPRGPERKARSKKAANKKK